MTDEFDRPTALCPKHSERAGAGGMGGCLGCAQQRRIARLERHVETLAETVGSLEARLESESSPTADAPEVRA